MIPVDELPLDELCREVVAFRGIDTTSYMEHDWKKDNGGIDILAYQESEEYVSHNGPECSRCGYHFCEHCENGWNSNLPCRFPLPDYLNDLNECFALLPYYFSIQSSYAVSNIMLYARMSGGKVHKFFAVGETLNIAILRAYLAWKLGVLDD